MDIGYTAATSHHFNCIHFPDWLFRVHESLHPYAECYKCNIWLELGVQLGGLIVAAKIKRCILTEF